MTCFNTSSTKIWIVQIELTQFQFQSRPTHQFFIVVQYVVIDQIKYPQIRTHDFHQCFEWEVLVNQPCSSVFVFCNHFKNIFHNHMVTRHCIVHIGFNTQPFQHAITTNAIHIEIKFIEVPQMKKFWDRHAHLQSHVKI